MSPVVRTPQEKKSLSYELDRRNSYGENDKSSRKAIPKFKADSNRSMRRISAQLVSQDLEMTDARLANATFKGLHPVKRKSPDTALGEVVRAKGACPEYAEISNGQPALNKEELKRRNEEAERCYLKKLALRKAAAMERQKARKAEQS